MAGILDLPVPSFTRRTLLAQVPTPLNRRRNSKPMTWVSLQNAGGQVAWWLPYRVGVGRTHPLRPLLQGVVAVSIVRILRPAGSQVSRILRPKSEKTQKSTRRRRRPSDGSWH